MVWRYCSDNPVVLQGSLDTFSPYLCAHYSSFSSCILQRYIYYYFFLLPLFLLHSFLTSPFSVISPPNHVAIRRALTTPVSVDMNKPHQVQKVKGTEVSPLGKFVVISSTLEGKQIIIVWVDKLRFACCSILEDEYKPTQSEELEERFTFVRPCCSYHTLFASPYTIATSGTVNTK